MTLRVLSTFAAVALAATAFSAPAALAKPAGGAAAVQMIDTDNDEVLLGKNDDDVPRRPSTAWRRTPTAPSTPRS